MHSFAALAIRTSGVYFLLLTLALGMIVWGICLRWTSVTGGENGLRGTVRPEMLTEHIDLYWFVLAVFVVLVFLMWRFVNSPFGLTLKGIRESESRMRALGYNPVWLCGEDAGAGGYKHSDYSVSIQKIRLVLAEMGL